MNTAKKNKVEIKWKPDRKGDSPLYYQIVQYIAEKIQDGVWASGDRLPSQREMAELFGVNRSTVVTAMEELISYGIISGDHGGGTRVSGGSWSLLLAKPLDWNKYIQSSVFKANKPTIQTINHIEFEPGYVRLGTGELSPKLYPKELLKGILQKLPERMESLNYVGPLGLRELREELSLWLEENRGIKAEPDNIVITTGSLQALQLISICMLKRGSNVYTEAPTYLKSLQTFQSMGMNLLGVSMDEEGIRYGLMKNQNMADSIIYTIPTLQNPTGQIMSQKRREGLLNFCQKNNIPLIEDDAYGDLWFEKRPPLPIKAMDNGGNVLYLGTISKTMAPGLRVGWVVGPKQVVYRLGDVKIQTDNGSSSISQWAMAELLKEDGFGDYIVDIRAELKRRRDLALEALNRHFRDIAAWNVPEGGFYIWLRLQRKLSMDKLFDRALENGILINPGNLYDYRENNALRLSYSYADTDEFAKSIELLRKIIDEL